MKKLLVGLAAAATIVALAAPTVSANITDLFIQSAIDDLVAWDPEFATIAPTAAPASDQQFVAGSLFIDDGEVFWHVRVSAHSGATGANPTGSVLFTFEFFGPVQVKADVTCLNVTGNTAAVEARIRGESPIPGADWINVGIVDGGNPGDLHGMSPDFAFVGFSGAPGPVTCVPGFFTIGGEQHGNFVVKDDMPLP